MAHQLAMANPGRVKADVIDASEFPQLSRAYQVMAVPKIVINDTVSFEGAVPESAFVGQVKKAVDLAQAKEAE